MNIFYLCRNEYQNSHPSMIHIACNIDSNYVRHCAVTLVSVFENNKEESFTAHIIARDLSETEREILTRLAARYNNQVCFYEPDIKLLEGFTIRKFSKRISMATYYRCILSELIPADIDRLLYLDCDIVVLGDLRPYWNTPIDHVGVAAVEDMGCREPERYEILKYPMEDLLQRRCPADKSGLLAPARYRSCLHRLLPQVPGADSLQRPGFAEQCFTQR